MTPQELEDLVFQGDPDATLERLAALPEAERNKLYEAAEALSLKSRTGGRSQNKWTYDYPDEVRTSATLALYACCSLARAKKLSTMGVDELAARAWLRLKPAWLEEAACVLVEKNIHNYLVARALVRAGVSRKPDSPQYTLGLMDLFGWRFGGSKLRDMLMADPDILNDEIWKLFEVEGGGETSMAAVDKYARTGWQELFLQLAAEGRLSRERLLDASLETLARDFAQFRAGWFSALHEALRPTLEERRQRLDSYLQLLGSAIPPTVSFAMEAIRQVDAATPIDAEVLLGALKSVAGARSKGLVKSALKLASAAAKRAPSSARKAALFAVDALVHEASDVQKAALDLLDGYGDKQDAVLRAEVAERAALVAPSLRGRLASWIETRAAVIVPLEVVPMTDTRPLSLDRVEDPEEVVALCAHLLEDDGDPSEVERALDGLAWLGRTGLERLGERLRPLTKRAGDLYQNSLLERDISLSFARLILGLGSGKLPAPHHSRTPLTLQDLLTARIESVARGLKQGSRRLLSLPTDQGGGIDARTLLDRIASCDTTDVLDGALALLRLRDDGRAEALVAAKDQLDPKDELCVALRYALGEDVPIGRSPGLWIAAARARSPNEDDPQVLAKHGALGPDAARAARPSYRIDDPTSASGYVSRELRLDPGVPMCDRQDVGLISVLFWADTGPFASACGGSKGMVRWSSTVWPQGSETFFGCALPRLFFNRDWFSSYWANAAYFERLLDARLMLGPMALATLAIGLHSKDANEAGISVDAMCKLIEASKLDGRELGGVMADFRAADCMKHARWAKTLARVASMSKLHTKVVATTIQRLLRGDPKRAPRDEKPLVDLLRELLAELEVQVDDEEARAYLCASRHKKDPAWAPPHG